MTTAGPHDDLRPLEAGASPARAKAAMVLVHGRGATARSMIDFAEGLAQPDIALIAPQAGGFSWYDHSFLAPLAANEPGISSGLRAIGRAFETLDAQGIAAGRAVLLGFSQGACLALEYVARFPRRLAGVVGLSGGLIGNGELSGGEVPNDKTFDYPGDLAGTPVFLGCNENDPHIPIERVHRTAEIFRELGGKVDLRVYRGAGHGINDDEVRYLRGLLASLPNASGRSRA